VQDNPAPATSDPGTYPGITFLAEISLIGAASAEEAD